jgi:hypothetical protein
VPRAVNHVFNYIFVHFFGPNCLRRPTKGVFNPKQSALEFVSFSLGLLNAKLERIPIIILPFVQISLSFFQVSELSLKRGFVSSSPALISPSKVSHEPERAVGEHGPANDKVEPPLNRP